MADYPTSAYNPASKATGNTITAAFFNNPDAEIRAIELALISTGLAHHLFPDATTRTLGTATNPWGTGYFGAVAVYVNDTTNANVTTGLTINQGAADDQLLAFKSSDVAHGVTDNAETDTYGFIQKAVAAEGGLHIQGLTETAIGVHMRGVGTTTDTARSISAIGAVTIDGVLKSGTGTTVFGANGNVFVVRNQAEAQFLVDAEGDVHYNGTTNATSWDDHDDVVLLETLRQVTGRPNFKHSFGADVQAHARVLHETGVITMNADGRPFVSTKGLNGLLIDAVRQVAHRLARVEQKLLEAA